MPLKGMPAWVWVRPSKWLASRPECSLKPSEQRDPRSQSRGHLAGWVGMHTLLVGAFFSPVSLATGSLQSPGEEGKAPGALTSEPPSLPSVMSIRLCLDLTVPNQKQSSPPPASKGTCHWIAGEKGPQKGREDTRLRWWLEGDGAAEQTDFLALVFIPVPSHPGTLLCTGSV